ncbi:major tail protein [Natronincola ferrireducens]|uniref:Phage major tail protein, phi13 family n=1 Tax=Natronincola ferrireducens TaxID=393762 RepID=A0A1G9I676_9FIRM|nr:major tail protein [Natronincola ferrireducens]SDL20602.1 phage major tail protein, phi13 family [Natronincola ferrireducens]
MKKAYRVNLRKLVYAKLESDTPTGVSYSEVKKLSEAMQIQLTPTLATGTLYGDGVKQSVVTKLTGITAVIDATKIPIDAKAEICGHTYENGVLVESGKDVAPWIAIGYEVPQDVEGVSEYVWLLKGRAQPYASTVQQATDNINFSTDSVTVEFVPRDYDGEIKRLADSADDAFTAEMAAAWFGSVPGTTGGE